MKFKTQKVERNTKASLVIEKLKLFCMKIVLKYFFRSPLNSEIKKSNLNENYKLYAELTKKDF